MSVVWTNGCLYRNDPFKKETHLEDAILRVQETLFGRDRIYLPVKRMIGIKGRVRNIPDGYLIDLTGPSPRLFVVENELAQHEPLRHIAAQILEFSFSFEDDGRRVKSILFDAVNDHPDARTACERYAAQRNFRNVDHLLEFMVFEAPFAALVIIDELPDNLEVVLSKKFQFGVEVIELARYKNDDGQHIYEFEPFLAEVAQDVEPAANEQVDTVVVPARADGVDSVFLGEKRWYAIRLHGSMRPQIRHIALYQTAPVSAITHVAEVRSIEPWKDTSKYVVNFAAPAKKIGPIPLVKRGRVKALQNLRYTTRARLASAKSLDDIW